MSDIAGIERFTRSDLVKSGGYTPLGRELGIKDVIMLDANENAYGCSPRIHQALASARNLHIYSDDNQVEFKALLQEYTGISAEHIVAGGGGSINLINRVWNLFLEPGDEVITCVPAYELFPIFTARHRGKSVEVPRNEDFSININALKVAISKRTKMIVIDNPGNPTGKLSCQDDILEIADTGLPLLVDEAYFEFSGETVAPLVSQYKNLMVLRTFSKWAGLGGVRIGYGIFPPKIADYLMRLKLPYDVDVLAMVAVRETLKDVDYLMGNVKAIVAERERLFGELKKLKFLKPFPSHTNFILVSVLQDTASDVYKRLLDKGILVHYYDLPLLRNYLRISVGKPEHTDALLKALWEIGDGISGQQSPVSSGK